MDTIHSIVYNQGQTAEDKLEDIKEYLWQVFDMGEDYGEAEH